MSNAFDRLLAIMHTLRAPGGCPWDAEQTFESLRPYLIEEAYEVLEAMSSGDAKAHCAELGDLLLQVVFQAEIAAETGLFDIDAVCEAISDKLVRRHPHVFASASLDTAAEVESQWESIKRGEREAEGVPRPSVLDGLPLAMPALQRAWRMTQKAASVGFDWSEATQVLDKVDEEIAEMRAEIDHGDIRAAQAELGDCLFALANLARHLGRDPEDLLRDANNRFDARFRRVEELAQPAGGLRAHDLETLEAYWQQAKREGVGPLG
jgi:MazG family protein